MNPHTRQRRPSDAQRNTNYFMVGTGADGIERAEAFFLGKPFSIHRHDTYAIGITFFGVQCFHYRGERWHCLPRQCHILHPDEAHDGWAGTAAGFGYRVLYIDPALIQNALGGRPLPFVSNPVVGLTATQLAGVARAWDLEDDIDELSRIEIAVAAAELLTSLVEPDGDVRNSLPMRHLLRVRDLILSAPAERYSLTRLETLAQLDRWTLARQFRAAFGTSPTRFRSMRQLDIARRQIRVGASLSEAAHQAGFSDQSHMTRKFRNAYGLSPARWAATLR